MYDQLCEHCIYLVCDDETGEPFCEVDIDEDDLARLYAAKPAVCPYFRSDDDYAIVRHQN